MPDDDENQDFVYNIDFDYSDIDRNVLNFAEKIKSSVADLDRLVQVLNTSIMSGTRDMLQSAESQYTSSFSKISTTISGINKQLENLPATVDLKVNLTGADVEKQFKSLLVRPVVRPLLEYPEFAANARDIYRKGSIEMVIKPVTDDFEVQLPENYEEIVNTINKSATQGLVNEILNGIYNNARTNIIGEDTTEHHGKYQKGLLDLTKSLAGVNTYLGASDDNATVEEINALIKDEIVPIVKRINSLNTTDSEQIQEAISIVSDLANQLQGRGFGESPVPEQGIPKQRPARLTLPVPDLDQVEDPEEWTDKVNASISESAFRLMEISEEVTDFRKNFSGETADALEIISTLIDGVATRERAALEVLMNIPNTDQNAYTILTEQISTYLSVLNDVKKRNIGDPIGAEGAINDLNAVIDQMDTLMLRVNEDLDSIHQTGESGRIKIFDPAEVANERVLADSVNIYLNEVRENIGKLHEACVMQVPVVPDSIAGFEDLTKQFNELVSDTLKEVDALSTVAVPDSDWAVRAAEEVGDFTQTLFDAQNAMNDLMIIYNEMSNNNQLQEIDFSSGISKINAYYAAILRQRKAMRGAISTAQEMTGSSDDLGTGIGFVGETTLELEDKLQELNDIQSTCNKSFGSFEKLLVNVRRATDGGASSFRDMRDAIDGSSLAMLELGEQVASISGAMLNWSRSTMKSVIRDQEAVLELQGRMKWGNAKELVDEIVKNSQGLLSEGDAATAAKSFAEAGMTPGNISGIMKGARKMAVAKGTSDDQAQQDILSALQSGDFRNYNLQETYGIYQNDWMQATETAAYEATGQQYKDITDPYQAMQARAAGLEKLIGEKYKHIDESILRPSESLERLMVSFDKLQKSLISNFVPALQLVADILNTIVNVVNMLPGPLKAGLGAFILFGAGLALVYTQIERIGAGLDILKKFSTSGPSVLGKILGSANENMGKGYKSVLGGIWDTIRGHQKSTEELGKEEEGVKSKTAALQELATGGYGDTIKKIKDWIGAHLQSIKVMALDKIGMDQETFAAKGLRGAMGATLTKMKEIYAYYAPMIALRYAHIKAIVLETVAKVKSIYAESGGSGVLKHIYDAIAARYKHIKVIGLEIIAKVKSTYADKGYSGVLKVIYDIIKARMASNALLQTEYFLKLKTIALSKYEGAMTWLKGTKEAPGKIQPILDIFTKLKGIYYGTDGAPEGGGILDKVSKAGESVSSVESLSNAAELLKGKLGGLKDTFPKVTEVASKFSKVVGGIGGSVMSKLTPAIGGIAPMIMGIIPGLGGASIGFGGLGAAALGAAAGLWAFLAPLLPIIVPLLLVAGAIFYLIGGFDGLNKIIGDCGKAIGDFGAWIMGVLQPIIDFFGKVWESLQTIVGGIMGVFGALFSGIGEGFMEGMKSVFDPIMEIFSSLWEIFSEIGGMIMEVISSIFPSDGGDGKEFFDMLAGGAKVLGKAIGLLLTLPLQIIILPLKFVAAVLKLIAGGFHEGAKAAKPLIDSLGLLKYVFFPILIPIQLLMMAFDALMKGGSKLGEAIGGPFEILKFVLLPILGPLGVIISLFSLLTGASKGLGKSLGDPFKFLKGAISVLMSPLEFVKKIFIAYKSVVGELSKTIGGPFTLLKGLLDAVTAPLKLLESLFEGLKKAALGIVNAIKAPFDAFLGWVNSIANHPLVKFIFGIGEPAAAATTPDNVTFPSTVKEERPADPYRQASNALELFNSSYEELDEDQRAQVDRVSQSNRQQLFSPDSEPVEESKPPIQRAREVQQSVENITAPVASVAPVVSEVASIKEDLPASPEGGNGIFSGLFSQSDRQQIISPDSEPEEVSKPPLQVAREVQQSVESIAAPVASVAPVVSEVASIKEDLPASPEGGNGIFSGLFNQSAPSVAAGTEGTDAGITSTGSTAQEDISGGGGTFGAPVGVEKTGAAQQGNVSVMIQGASFPITISSNELAHAITNKQINMDQVADRIAKRASEMLAEQISREITSWGG